jgi:hypothetical protein
LKVSYEDAGSQVRFSAIQGDRPNPVPGVFGEPQIVIETNRQADPCATVTRFLNEFQTSRHSFSAAAISG